MRTYECHICHGKCDPGELENGVCFDCRSEAVKMEDARRLRVRKELNRSILAMQYAQQADGQLVLDYGR